MFKAETEKQLADLRKKLEDQENENKILAANMKQACAELSSVSAENVHLKAELGDLKKDLGILSTQISVLTAKNFDLDKKLNEATAGYELSSTELAKAKIELDHLKKKLIEGEYAAYCFSLKERSAIDGRVQDLQLVLRKNCDGEAIFEFENRNGDLRVIKASLITDIESDPDNKARFCIKYKPYGLFGNKAAEYFESEYRNRLIGHAKNFILRYKHDEQKTDYPDVNYQRNILDDLKRLFFG